VLLLQLVLFVASLMARSFASLIEKRSVAPGVVGSSLHLLLVTDRFLGGESLLSNPSRDGVEGHSWCLLLWLISLASFNSLLLYWRGNVSLDILPSPRPVIFSRPTYFSPLLHLARLP
jgi:hypothetical protein